MRTLDLSQIGTVYIACGYSDSSWIRVNRQYFCSAADEASGSRHYSGTETDSFCCINVWRTDDISGHEAGRKYSSLPSSNTAVNLPNF